MKQLMRFELKKIFMKRIVRMAVLGLLILNILFVFSDYYSMYAFDGKSREGSGGAAVEIDQEISERYQGLLTDEKVGQMLEEFRPKVDTGGLNAARLYQNAFQSSVFARFSDVDGNWNGRSVSDVFGNEAVKIGYVNGWLHISRNMIRIFMILAFVIILMGAPVFSGEYSGADNILLTSRYGKTKCSTAKGMAALAAAFFLTAVFSAVNLLLGWILYGGEGLSCSILFAPVDFVENYIPFNLTCGELMVYQVLLMFACGAGVTGITLFLSSVCKNQVTALAASSAAFILPILLPVTETNPLYRVVLLMPVYYVQFISIMSAEPVKNGLIFAVWSVSVGAGLMAVGFIFSKHFFAKHPVGI